MPITVNIKSKNYTFEFWSNHLFSKWQLHAHSWLFYGRCTWNGCLFTFFDGRI